MNGGEADQRAERARLRERLIGTRLAMSPEERDERSRRIERSIGTLLDRLDPKQIGFCWPFRGEFDVRPVVERYIARGGRAALPATVPGQPLVFRAWMPSTPLAEGRYGIPIPEDGELVSPELILIPLVGFDAAGYRLGYGGGYFDRTLAALDPKPCAVGVGFELGRLDSLRPAPWDMPCDYVVTEEGVWRRDAGALLVAESPSAPAKK